MFLCLPQDSEVLVLLIINQGSVFLKISTGCYSVMKVQVQTSALKKKVSVLVLFPSVSGSVTC